MNSDVFFISYDEPNADFCWESVKNKIPNAQRIHGMKGFDSAYKACGKNSSCERFFTIDGDNELLTNPLENQIDWASIPNTAVLSWSSINSINGLTYGNGGIKNWPKATVLSMKTHERAEIDDPGSVDFCFQLNYLQMPDALSIARINGSPYQAFRAGFREGVKMLLVRGNRISFSNHTNKSIAVQQQIWHENLSRLKVWCCVGSDVPNGLWAMLGASMGAKSILNESWNHELIRDYEWFNEFWNNNVSKNIVDIENEIEKIHEYLNSELGFNLTILDSKSSTFFKSAYINPKRFGHMFK